MPWHRIGIRAQAAQTELRARTALDETQAATVQMHALDHAANDIASVAGLISAVAAQTKHLAVNATIEAARAGPAGAGFAVVANEVRLLANRSGQEALLVQRTIAGIAASVAAARASIAAIDTSAQDVHGLAAFIAQAVAAQEVAAASMGGSLADILGHATNVESSIETISALTREGAGNLEAIGNEGCRLSQKATDLRREVADFLGFLSQIEPGVFSCHEPVEMDATLTVEGVEHAGHAIFPSEVAVHFAPGFIAETGAEGDLRTALQTGALRVRIAGSGGGRIELQPPLDRAARLRLRTALGAAGAMALRGDALQPAHART